jgi:hypothetical protein
MERQFEETVEGTSSCIDGCNSGRSQNYIFLFGDLTYVFQKGRLSCSCFSCEKNGLAGILNQAQCVLEFRIVCIDRSTCHVLIFFPDKDNEKTTESTNQPLYGGIIRGFVS